MRRSLVRQFTARKAAYPFRLSLLGVPEQVNIPIQLCQEQGIFSKFGVEVDYTTVPEGTGAMLKKLHHNEADLAITVTDGFIAGQAAGFNVQLVGTYVDSPLTWAVSAHPDTPFKSVEELFQKKDIVKVGISRLQSGSHTMSHYMADLLAKQSHNDEGQVKLTSKQLHFEELGSFSNLRDGISRKDIDIFLWEVFTTKPYHDSGELKYIGEVTTPWPAFSIVAANSGHFLSGHDSRAAHMFRHRFLPALAEGAAFFKANTLRSVAGAVGTAGGGTIDAGDGAGSSAGGVRTLGRNIRLDSNAVCDDSVALIVKRFGHKSQDAERWLAGTQYGLPDMSVDVERMRRALHTLQAVGLVPASYPVGRLWGSDRDVLCNDAISFRHAPPPPSLPSPPSPSPLPLTSRGQCAGDTTTTDDQTHMNALLRSALML